MNPLLFITGVCFFGFIFAVMGESIHWSILSGILCVGFSYIGYQESISQENKRTFFALGAIPTFAGTVSLLGVYSTTFAFVLMFASVIAVICFLAYQNRVKDLIGTLFTLISLISVWLGVRAQNEKMVEYRERFPKVTIVDKYEVQSYYKYRKLEDLCEGFYGREKLRTVICEYIDKSLNEPDFFISNEEVDHYLLNDENAQKLLKYINDCMKEN